MVHFDLIFIYGGRYGSKFVFLAYGYLVVPVSLLIDTSFFSALPFAPLSTDVKN